MSAHGEAGRAVGHDRASEIVLAGNVSELNQNPTLFNQAAWLSARFKLGDAHARALAEAHFGGLHSRAGR